MDAIAFVKELDKCKFFDGYTPAAREKAETEIRGQLEKGLSGSLKRLYEKFPGMSLIFLSYDGEWDYEPFDEFVQQYVNASFGMFKPTQIEDIRDEETGGATLSFTVGKNRYSATAADCGWVPGEFMELMDEANHVECNGLMFKDVHHPESGQSCTMTLCTPKAYKAIIKSRLIPSEPDEVFGVDWS